MERTFPPIHLLVAVALCLTALSGCSRRTAELETQVARLQKENAELKKELEKVAKLSSAIQDVLKSYEELTPQMDEIQREIDSTRDYVSKIEALTPKGMNKRARAELKLQHGEAVYSILLQYVCKTEYSMVVAKLTKAYQLDVVRLEEIIESNREEFERQRDILEGRISNLEDENMTLSNELDAYKTK